MVQNMTMPLSVAETDGIIAQGEASWVHRGPTPTATPRPSLPCCARISRVWSSTL